MIARPGVFTSSPRLRELKAHEALVIREAHRHDELSYAEHGASAGALPAGYRHVDREWVLGVGESCWQAARAAILDWQVFPRDAWFRLFPPRERIAAGDVLLFDVRAGGVRWTSLVRALDGQDDERCVARSIGTLELHHARGEERFELRRTESDEVRYRLRSFSRWKRLAPRVFSRYAAALQRRFAEESVRAVRAAVAEHAS